MPTTMFCAHGGMGILIGHSRAVRTFGRCGRRVSDGYRQVVSAHPNQAVAIFAHGGVFATTIKGLCPDVDLAELLRQENHNCSITEVEVELQGDTLHGQLLQWAACTHLSGEAADLVSGTPPREYYQK